MQSARKIEDTLKAKVPFYFFLAICFATPWLGGCEKTKTEDPKTVTADAEVITYPDAMIDIPDAGFVRPDTGIVIQDSGPGIQACAPALEMTPAQPFTTPLALMNFVASGGTGDYRFALSENNSGAVLNMQSGAYLAGSLVDTKDTVVLSDLGCVGTTSVSVEVLSRIDLKPLRATISPNGSVLFDASLGSGQFTFAVMPRSDGASTGTISSGGFYQAPSSEGTDIIRVRDQKTSDSIDAYIQIESGAELSPNPPTLYLPQGSHIKLSIEGGSGFFDVSPSSASFQFQDGVLTASTAGESTLAVLDRYTGQSTQIKAFSLLSQTLTTTRSGTYINSGAVVKTGDINQDGFEDAVIAWAEINHSSNDSGAVYIYAGTASGLDPNPVRVLSEGGRSSRFGSSMTISDLDGDGMPELIVGAIRADLGARDNGGIFIYSGQANSFFSAQPTRMIGGVNAYDLSGFAVEACDFNADGILDLAIGAAYAEDRFRRVQSRDQGAVYIHLGRSSGFLDTPDLALYGDLPVGDGTFIGRSRMYLGRSLAAGDFNGDGVCDLAAGTYTYDAGSANTDDGLVFIYRGQAKTDTLNGGLTPWPVRGYAATLAPEITSHFARFLAAGDLDNDQADELIVTQYRAENAAAGGSDRGAIRIYQELDLPDTPMLSLRAVETATLSWFGENNSDNAGWYVRAADYDGDMIKDLIIGNHNDELPGLPTNAGTIAIFLGRSGFLPDMSMAHRWISGPTAQNRFGMFFDVAGDLDRDGQNDLVAISAYDDSFGINLGAPWFVPGDDSRELQLLQMPGYPGGDDIGRALDFVGDVNGDGYTDLAVGAPRVDSQRRGINVGAAAVYFGSALGYASQPSLEFREFRRHSGGDYVGWDVSRAGDFNGDGVDDLAILARYEDQPASFSSSTYTVDANCSTTAFTNNGAVFVFLGNAGGPLSAEPAFIIYGPHNRAELWALVGGLNVDNDGYDDLVVSGGIWDQAPNNNVGGFAVFKGRTANSDGRTHILCTPDTMMYGSNANEQIGYSLSRAGDLDGDGCDEFAVGSREEDNGNSNQGTVRIVFGAGSNCSDTDVRMLSLESRSRSARAGHALAGGLDVDGDQIPDLLVGGTEYRNNNNTVGAVWLLTGAYLRTLAPEPITNAANATFYGFTDPSNQLNLHISGTTGASQFGASVALIPELSGAGRAGIAVGAPYGDFSGTALTGETLLFSYAPGIGFIEAPVVALIGESQRPAGRVGSFVRAGQINGRSVIAVGGLESSGQRNFSGAVYVVELQP